MAAQIDRPVAIYARSVFHRRQRPHIAIDVESRGGVLHAHPVRSEWGLTSITSCCVRTSVVGIHVWNVEFGRRKQQLQHLPPPVAKVARMCFTSLESLLYAPRSHPLDWIFTALHRRSFSFLYTLTNWETAELFGRRRYSSAGLEHPSTAFDQKPRSSLVLCLGALAPPLRPLSDVDIVNLVFFRA